MSKGIRIILWVLCGAMILSAPFLISSPSMLSEVKWDMMEQMNEEEGEELDLSRILFSSAMAEDPDAVEEEVVEDDPEAFGEAVYTLPLDFTVPPAPKAENYSENGYADETIRVTIEEREVDGVIWHLAFVKIASATQFRTATAGKLTSSKTARVSSMARNNHAVVAINGDNFVDKPDSTLFEYRMTQKIRSKTNRLRDILIIDENGDFHFSKARPNLSKDQAKKEQAAELGKIADEHTIVNAYCFGPALVIDGVEQEIDPDYKYNPNGKEPRAAIGQTGPLSYLLVIAEGRGESSVTTQQNLAHFMAELGCQQAYNLDGGNSAEMVFGDQIFKGMPGGDERSLSDIIYFATAVPEE
ncbi:MAG: phosphodiester glycosidase family protein [Lachnospiraceae bacterium]|nr:phosphodiester glycosidase family protein [Lachnospiraceae bacterium]